MSLHHHYLAELLDLDGSNRADVHAIGETPDDTYLLVEDRWTGRQVEIHAKVREPLQCAICGKPLGHVLSSFRGPAYCSQECREAA